MPTIELLHGADHIIEKPKFLAGKEHNDYGRGFYCTRIPEMAREWACKENVDGFVNRYEFDTTGMSILNLMDGEHSILNWIALLLKHRVFSLKNEIAIDARDYIIENFSVDTTMYDVIIGYRANDSYFSFAESFVENGLPLRSLNKALRLGKLGEQIALVSEKAFEAIRFLGAETVSKGEYYPKFLSRDTMARKTYHNEIKKSRTYRDDIFVMDILREEMKNDDSRIQRILFK